MTLRRRLGAVCAFATVPFLAGCGSFAPITQPAGGFTSDAQIASRTRSWVLPEAKSEDLLYVSDYYSVLMFSYPKGELVGTLKNFYSAAGECVDSEGNVFVSNWRPRGVYEYAHGGTKRLAFFRTTKVGPLSCAISPTTGDLAICGSSNAVEIYKAGQQNDVMFKDERMQYGTLARYDNNGDLFFLGMRVGRGQKQQLSELKAGSSHFTSIRADSKVYVEGGLQ